MTDRLLKVLTGEEKLSKEDKAFLFGYADKANDWAKDYVEDIDTNHIKKFISDDKPLDKDFERVLDIIDKVKGDE